MRDSSRTIAYWLCSMFMTLLKREHFEIGRQLTGVYLTRWTILGRRFSGGGGRLFLHYFHQGDPEPYCHDHPWPFWSLILWGGYFEETKPQGQHIHGFYSVWYGVCHLLRRPANWAHRVRLHEGRPAISLVWTGLKCRQWGFHCPRGWIPWRQHEQNYSRSFDGCGE